MTDLDDAIVDAMVAGDQARVDDLLINGRPALARANQIAGRIAEQAKGAPEHTRVGDLMEMKQQIAQLTGEAKTRMHRAGDPKRRAKRRQQQASRKGNRR